MDGFCNVFLFAYRVFDMASQSVYLKTALFTVLVPGTVAGVIPRWLARRDQLHLPIDPILGRTVGGVPVIVGSLVYLHTTGRFAGEGRGTPSPADEPEELVTGGIYARVRNPMYLGVLLIITGQALWYRSVSVLWWALGCWLGFHNRVLEYEEPHLAAKHGEEYEQYRDRVPRWLPRVRPLTAQRRSRQIARCEPVDTFPHQFLLAARSPQLRCPIDRRSRVVLPREDESNESEDFGSTDIRLRNRFVRNTVRVSQPVD